MLPFATEFPIDSPPTNAAFVAELTAWLRGMAGSSVLSSRSDEDLDVEHAYIKSDFSEELRIRQFDVGNKTKAIGFRHDLPDAEGRLWRTECVTQHEYGNGFNSVIRFRTQCIAQSSGAVLQTPRKPFLIKSILQSGWGGFDLDIKTSDQPFWLGDDEKSLNLALKAVYGEATHWLPVVYISSISASKWIFSTDEIVKLAYDLGGIAHVIVEPNRSFSHKLREFCEAKNPYGGTIALSVPGRGIVRRYYIGWQYQTAREVSLSLKTAASSIRGQMPSIGWDWSELQEKALRAQREINKSQLSAAETEDLFNSYVQQLEDLQAEKKILEDQLRSRPSIVFDDENNEAFLSDLVSIIGPEIYPGEISDRIRYAAATILTSSHNGEVDARTLAVMQRISESLPQSTALGELRKELRDATKDPKKIGARLTSLLMRRGYYEKSDKNHIRLAPVEGFDGLGPVTVAKTPSDGRGLENARKQVERALGITKLGQ